MTPESSGPRTDAPLPDPVLVQLMRVIQDRKLNPPPESYTTSLFRGGVPKIGDKILEEAHEVIEAATSIAKVGGRSHVVHEAADLIYHLLVLLGHCEIDLVEVETELARRFGISGMDEKANRQKKP